MVHNTWSFGFNGNERHSFMQVIGLLKSDMVWEHLVHVMHVLCKCQYPIYSNMEYGIHFKVSMLSRWDICLSGVWFLLRLFFFLKKIKICEGFLWVCELWKNTTDFVAYGELQKWKIKKKIFYWKKDVTLLEEVINKVT